MTGMLKRRYHFLYEGEVKGVIELGSLDQFTERQLGFLDQVGESMAIAVHSAQSREQTKTLLEESQSQAEELQSQQEELLSQQEELRTANEELEEKTAELEAQQEQVAAAAAQAAREYSENIVKALREPLIILKEDLRVVTANPAFYSTFKVVEEQTEDELIYELGNRQWDIPTLRKLLEEVIPESGEVVDY